MKSKTMSIRAFAAYYQEKTGRSCSDSAVSKWKKEGKITKEYGSLVKVDKFYKIVPEKALEEVNSKLDFSMDKNIFKVNSGFNLEDDDPKSISQLQKDRLRLQNEVLELQRREKDRKLKEDSGIYLNRFEYENDWRSNLVTIRDSILELDAHLAEILEGVEDYYQRKALINKELRRCLSWAAKKLENWKPHEI